MSITGAMHIICISIPFRKPSDMSLEKLVFFPSYLGLQQVLVSSRIFASFSNLFGILCCHYCAVEYLDNIVILKYKYVYNLLVSLCV